jgi:hypothetical protein
MIWRLSRTIDVHRKNGNPNVTWDLRQIGERCSRPLVYRLMRAEGLKSQVGYGRKPTFNTGPENEAAANLLDRQFNVAAPTGISFCRPMVRSAA